MRCLSFYISVGGGGKLSHSGCQDGEMLRFVGRYKNWQLEVVLDLFRKLYAMRDVGRWEGLLRWILTAYESFR